MIRRMKNMSEFSIFRVRSSYGVNLQQSIDSFTSTAGVRLGIFGTLTAIITFECKHKNIYNNSLFSGHIYLTNAYRSQFIHKAIIISFFFQGIYNHVTARVSQDTEHFLLNPFGGQITTNQFETFICLRETFKNVLADFVPQFR